MLDALDNFGALDVHCQACKLIRANSSSEREHNVAGQCIRDENCMLGKKCFARSIASNIIFIQRYLTMHPLEVNDSLFVLLRELGAFVVHRDGDDLVDAITHQVVREFRDYDDARIAFIKFQDYEKLRAPDGRCWLVDDLEGRGVSLRLCECRADVRGSCNGVGAHTVHTTVTVILNPDGFETLARLQFAWYYKPRTINCKIGRPSTHQSVALAAARFKKWVEQAVDQTLKNRQQGIPRGYKFESWLDDAKKGKTGPVGIMGDASLINAHPTLTARDIIRNHSRDLCGGTLLAASAELIDAGGSGQASQFVALCRQIHGANHGFKDYQFRKAFSRANRKELEFEKDTADAMTLPRCKRCATKRIFCSLREEGDDPPCQQCQDVGCACEAYKFS